MAAGLAKRISLYCRTFWPATRSGAVASSHRRGFALAVAHGHRSAPGHGCSQRPQQAPGAGLDRLASAPETRWPASAQTLGTRTRGATGLLQEFANRERQLNGANNMGRLLPARPGEGFHHQHLIDAEAARRFAHHGAIYVWIRCLDFNPRLPGNLPGVWRIRLRHRHFAPDSLWDHNSLCEPWHEPEVANTSQPDQWTAIGDDEFTGRHAIPPEFPRRPD